MLTQILREIKISQGTLNLDDLSCKLGVERSALQGMIGYWVRKGRLRDDDQVVEIVASCVSGSCGCSCAGLEDCPFIVRIPKKYSIPARDIE